MRKIILFNLVSLDGFFEGTNHDISWHNVDDEFNKFAIEQTSEVDTLLFGRVTYQLFEDFWPKAAVDPKTSKDDLEIANLINNMNKIVFSKTLTEVREQENWKHVTLAHEVNPEEIQKLKQQPGKDIAIFGSNNLSVSFLQKGLLDEFRIMVNPVVIGRGTRLFEGMHDKLSLKLLKTRAFHNGNVLLYYQPVEALD